MVKPLVFNFVGSSDSSVCRVCEGIGDLKNQRGAIVKLPDDNETRKRYAYIYMHHPSIWSLCNSAEAGCDMCRLMRDELQLFIEEDSDESMSACSPAPGTPGKHPESTINAAEPDDDASIATDLAEFTRPENLPGTRCGNKLKSRRFCLLHLSDRETGPRGSINRSLIELSAPSYGFVASIWVFNHSRPLNPDLDYPPYRHLLSDPHIDLINSWRRTCENEHSYCNQHPHIQQLPTRVLKSSLDPSNENLSVRLIETDGKLEGKYACLSYCWGHLSKENQIGQSLCENIEQYKEAIPVQELPKTIVDAIRICCKLGFEFLWVDRLCIVQDRDPITGRDDWKIEASKMCDYYSKSALTLSVPICSESSQSFLAERQEEFRERGRFAIVEYQDEESKSKDSLWFTQFEIKNLKCSWFLEHHWRARDRGKFEAYDWLRRAWTFQEWMLSPRVLHIGGLTLWDCFNGYANELHYRQMKIPTLQRSLGEFLGKGDSCSWNSIVEEYSKRRVTKKTDWLFALAGLAESYRIVTGWTYLAGVWKEELPFSLLWRANPLGADQGELTSLGMPSWSWAHFYGPVIYFSRSICHSAKALVSDSKCEYDPPGSMATVVEAWLDIDGRLSAMQDQRGRFNGTGYPIKRWGGIEVYAGKQWWDSFPDDGYTYSEDAIDEVKIKLLLLTVSEKDGPGSYTYGALVLHECGWKVDGRSVFRRVGMAFRKWPSHWYNDKGTMPPGEGPLWEQESIRII